MSIKLNDVPQKFECDSGSRVSIISISDFEKLNLNILIQDTDVSFRTHTGEVFKPLGVVKVNTSIIVVIQLWTYLLLNQIVYQSLVVIGSAVLA